MDTNEVKDSIARKPYQTPIFTVYGDAKLLTKAVGNMGLTADGGTMNTQKTS